MTFLTSGLAIAGACAIAVPIIIHLLFRQRRKPIAWAAMRFLLEAFRKHKRRLQLEQLLLLAVRCLIPLLLGLALAQPLLQGTILAKAAAGQRAVYLIVDNGLVSGLANERGRSALEAHVEAASVIIRQLSAGDAVGLIAAARPARGLLVPPSTDHGAVLDLLQSLKPDESPTDLSGAFTVARAALENAADRREAIIFLLSEFRTGSVSLDSPPPPAFKQMDNVRLLASPAAPVAAPNVQITAIEPVRNLILANANDGSGQIAVHLRRFGPQLASDVSRVKIAGEGFAPLEPQVIHWTQGDPEASAEFNAKFTVAAATEGDIGLTASIDHDALSADDQRFAVLEIRRKIRVLLIDRRSFGFERSLEQLTAGQWIRRALEPLGNLEIGGQSSGPIELVEVEPAALDLADIRAADAAIVPRPDLLNDNGWAILQGFLARQGLLIITPPGEVNIHSWTERLDKDLGLPWPIALETTDYTDGLMLAEEQPPSELTRLISSELSELSRPVLAYRVLPVEAEVIAAGHAQPILIFVDGSPMVVAGTPSVQRTEVRDQKSEDRGQRSESAGAEPSGIVIYLAASPELSWTTLPSKPMMVPLFHELIRQGLSAIRGTQKLSVGEQPSLGLGPAATDVIDPTGEKIALDQAGRPQIPFRRSGPYQVVDRSGQRIGTLAVNIDPRAGQTDAQSQSALNAWLANAGTWEMFDPHDAAASLGSTGNASHLAGVLLAAVLALALLETVMARRFSHAYATEALGSRRSALSETFASGLLAEGRKPKAGSLT